jgi:DNA ligase-1
MKKLETLYKRDTKGNIREWTICVNGNKFWTEGGIHGMKMNVAKPTSCTAKNIGHSNETSPEVQAELQAKAKWDKKLRSGYFTNVNDVDDKKFYEPMLAHNYKDRIAEVKYPVYSQPKLDGIRCVARLEKGEVVARTRNGKIIEAIPHITNELKNFLQSNPEIILDGELYNHDFKDNFNKITSLVRKQKPVRSASDTDNSFIKKQDKWTQSLVESESAIQYWIYDCPKIAQAKEAVPFSLRFTTLQNILQEKSCIKLVPTAEIMGQASLNSMYQEYLRDGYEGQMVRKDMGYEQKRSTSLLKRKEFQDAEYKVIDIEEGNGNRQGTAKNLTLIDPKSLQEFNSNIKGNFEYLAKIFNNKEDYIGKLATIKFFEYTPDGIPRFPYAIGFRDYE